MLIMLTYINAYKWALRGRFRKVAGKRAAGLFRCTISVRAHFLLRKNASAPNGSIAPPENFALSEISPEQSVE